MYEYYDDEWLIDGIEIMDDGTWTAEEVTRILPLIFFRDVRIGRFRNVREVETFGDPQARPIVLKL